VSILFIRNHSRDFNSKLRRKTINRRRASFKTLLRCLCPPSPLKYILLTEMHVNKPEKALHSIFKQDLSFFVSERVPIRRESTQVGEILYVRIEADKKKRSEVCREKEIHHLSTGDPHFTEIGRPSYLHDERHGRRVSLS
jgi:hypothetical protein